MMLLLVFLAAFSGAGTGYWLAAWLDARARRKQLAEVEEVIEDIPDIEPKCDCPIPREAQVRLIGNGGFVIPPRSVH